MNYEVEEREEFKVIGLSTRTENRGGKAMRDINNLWQRFFEQEIQQKIPNKISVVVYNIYTDYEIDHDTPYTVVVGCQVWDLDEIPDGMIGLTIPAGRYAVFRPKGKLPEVVVNTWNEIDKTDSFQRAYRADYDIYNLDEIDPDNADVEICVSIE
jgi:predicted transcriptional regulator YdeE